MRHIFQLHRQPVGRPGSAGPSTLARHRIVHCRWQTGERYCLLVDGETGLPLWWPTLYVTTQIRNTSKSVATMETALRSIQILLAYADGHGTSLEHRVRSREHLALHEVHALCDWAQRSFDRRPRNGRVDPRATVSKEQHHNRLSWMAKFFEWFARMLITTITPDDNAAISAVVKSILARRPRCRRGASLRDRALTDEQCHRLFEVLRPNHPDNPFEDPRTAERNELMVHLLRHTGIRRGEPLGIQVGDINWQNLSLTIHRRADEAHDPRTDQPRAKTLARTLPLSPDLTERLNRYVFGARRQTKGAGTHRYLIVTHRKGPYKGEPLSHAGLAKVFAALRRCDPLLKGLHAHRLRHTWNSKFSQTLDALPVGDRPTQARERQARTHLMGWSPGSGTAALYDQRHITKKANEAAQEMYEKAGVHRPRETDNG